MKKSWIAAVLAIGAGLWISNAADEPAPPNDRPHRPGGERMHRPVPPLIAVLDADHDGVISAEEIANAPAALKKLDKNGDGKLTPDELRPPMGDRPQGGPGGPRRPRDGQGDPK